MSQDEKVDGPKIAAQILNRMPAEQKEKIVAAMRAREPELTQEVESNMFRFDDIAELSARSIQLLIKEIDHADLVASLKTASEELRGILFNNMSARKKQIVEDDYSALPPMRLADVEEAQRRIISTVEDLRAKGLVRSESDQDLWV